MSPKRKPPQSVRSPEMCENCGGIILPEQVRLVTSGRAWHCSRQDCIRPRPGSISTLLELVNAVATRHEDYYHPAAPAHGVSHLQLTEQDRRFLWAYGIAWEGDRRTK